MFGIDDALIGAGISGLGGLLAGRGGPNYRKYKRPNFNFNLDENDPELEYMRRQLMYQGQGAHRDTVDELARAGLLGSSAGFERLDRTDMNTSRSLQDVLGSVYGARRSEAHGDYVGDVNFNRGLQQNQIEGDMASSRSAAGGLGHLAGGFIEDYWRRKHLGDLNFGYPSGTPGNYLRDASDYSYIPPERR